MADLGSIGTLGLLTKRHITGRGTWLRNAVIGGAQTGIRMGRSNSEGNPSPPSLAMYRGQRFRFRWGVQAGARTIQVDVKEGANEAPRPKMTVFANTDIGVNADVSGSAGASTGWVTIGPLAINPSSDGAVIVELEFPAWPVSGIAYWDNLESDSGKVDGFDAWYQGAPVIDLNDTQELPASGGTVGFGWVG